jgi:hypothetical protein
LNVTKISDVGFTLVVVVVVGVSGVVVGAFVVVVVGASVVVVVVGVSDQSSPESLLIIFNNLPSFFINNNINTTILPYQTKELNASLHGTRQEKQPYGAGETPQIQIFSDAEQYRRTNRKTPQQAYEARGQCPSAHLSTTRVGHQRKICAGPKHRRRPRGAARKDLHLA